jgi:3-methyladenine DNA glycosylase/8-oxoguanine DNA glycosylase
VDLRLTLGQLRTGFDDPTIRLDQDGVWLARVTSTGPATLRLARDDEAILADAWGPGAEEAMTAVPGLAGLEDDPAALIPRHPLVRDLQRRFPGLRLPRTGQLVPALVPAVIGQKVTATEALRAYAALVRKLGLPAPGPRPLRLSPSPESLALLPYFEFHPMGIERRRAEVLQNVGRLASRIETYTGLDPERARVRLREIPGIGPWTAAEATRVAMGDPDAVTLGDAHLPDLVSWALAGEPRADDERMLELLEPYRGQRARVVGLLEVAGIKIPRYGPRFAPRNIERI